MSNRRLLSLAVALVAVLAVGQFVASGKGPAGADEPKAEDRIFDIEGIRVIVDEDSLQNVDGSEVDYTESLMGSGFQVNNPNVVASCGCGSSFRIAEEEPSCGAAA